MSVSYSLCRSVDGQHAYDVLIVRDGRDEKVAHICYDKWTQKWALLHDTGLIEKFDTLLGARACAATSYG